MLHEQMHNGLETGRRDDRSSSREHESANTAVMG